MKRAVRVYFSGLIQGIFFRSFVKEQADKSNVVGFVRNLEDGRVEAFFEGQDDSVTKVIELCKTHKHAKVKSTEIKEEKLQDMKEFKILNI